MSTINAIGLMSGTSVDSIDAGVVTFKETNSAITINKIAGISYPIPDQIKKGIFNLFEDKQGALQDLVLMNNLLGELFSDAVIELLNNTGLVSEDIAVIGSHGQTIYHIAEKRDFCGQKLRGSLQIGEASIIAQRTGIPVVSDFRSADIAAGGSGAPLVPFLDLILAEKFGNYTAFQNIGGIGNVTFIENKDIPSVAFDTGPGNMIIDRLVYEFTGGKLTYDKDGEIGKKGCIRQNILSKWMEHPYFSKKPPKSTGREEFGTLFYDNYLKNATVTEDLIRTAEEFTAVSIVQSFRSHLTMLPSTLIINGGGGHNPIIVNAIRDQLKDCSVLTGDEAGISIDYKESAAFALMGYYAQQGKSNNVPSATGAYRKVVMGKLSLP
jgi:anhydro-N-acetylmuramic acid kinase